MLSFLLNGSSDQEYYFQPVHCNVRWLTYQTFLHVEADCEIKTFPEMLDQCNFDPRYFKKLLN